MRDGGPLLNKRDLIMRLEMQARCLCTDAGARRGCFETLKYGEIDVKVVVQSY